MIQLGLGEHATQFGLASMGRLVWLLSRSGLSLGGDHGHAGTVDLDLDHLPDTAVITRWIETGADRCSLTIVGLSRGFDSTSYPAKSLVSH